MQRPLKTIVGGLALAVVLGLAGIVGCRVLVRPAPAPTPEADLPAAGTPPAPPPYASSPVAVPPPTQTMGGCGAAGFETAAAANLATLDTLAWAPFRGRGEIGWRVYGPRIAHEVRTDCAVDTPAFARALAAWQADHRLAADGRLTPDTFERMRNGWDLQRPFQVEARKGCPVAPQAAELHAASRPERYGERAELVHPGALAAYRRLVGDARAAGVATDPTLLTIFSAYRDPLANAERCAKEGDCGGAARAVCSAHQTGKALDLNLGHAPGSRPDSTEDRNRLWMSQTPAYRWLVRNAPRYGFVNYAFEPWHWEWAGG